MQTLRPKHHLQNMSYRQGTLGEGDRRTLIFVHVQVIIVIIFEVIIILERLF